jgi:hypothetical protein
MTRTSLTGTRFDNLLGERFEVRNYPDPTQPVKIRRLS